MKNKILAFTIAEILISLGIIGVIAALTVPNLVKNIKNAELKTAFKKSYANLNNAYQSIIYDNGGLVYNCFYTRTWSMNSVECIPFFGALKNKLKVIRSYEGVGDDKNVPYFLTKDEVVAQGGTNLNSSCSGAARSSKEVWTLSDGSMIISYGGNFASNTPPLFILDVNGLRKPNKWGYDLFMLDFRNVSSEISKVRFEDDICGIYEKGGYRVNDILMNR